MKVFFDYQDRKTKYLPAILTNKAEYSNVGKLKLII